MRPECILVGLVAAVGALCFTQSAHADDEAVWALLKKPGHVVLLRHSNAPETPPDGENPDFKTCTDQRNLDEAGRAQARRVGEAFRKYGITAARFVSSQYCRAMDTAKLTGLGPVRALPALNQVYMGDLGGMHEAGEKGRAFIKTITGRPLTVLVSHVSNIQSIAGVSLSSGEMAVVHLDSSGAIKVDGRIKVP